MNFFLLLFLCFSCWLNAQTKVFGYVKDFKNEPLSRAEVFLQETGEVVRGDLVGYFQFVDLKPGSYTIIVTKPSYERNVIEFSISQEEKMKNLGDIVMNLSSSSEMGVVALDDDLADDGASVQPTIGLLSSGKDTFASVAAYELGAYWFRPRGVENRYNDVLFNGISMSKLDDGKIDFGNWGGLNDVTRYPYEFVENVGTSDFTFGNLGGVVYYNTRASSYRKGTSLTYSFADRSYNHRLMATHSTGLTRSGWALTVSGSRRWAEEGNIDGTSQDTYAYFASLEKKINDKHALNLTAFGVPTKKTSNSPNTEEVYDIMGKDYNAYWGWQDGEKRNSRRKKAFEPIFQLSHYWKMTDKSKLNTTFSFQTGSDARSRLDWFNAPDPSPTYYKKMPSYGNVTVEEFIKNSQINWDGLYMDNSLIPTSNNYLGINYVDSNGNVVTGKRAAYSLVEDVNRDDTFTVNTHFNTKIQDNWKFNLNLNYQNFSSDNFRRVKDMLGADFALNLDNFNNLGKFNMDNPSTIVRAGDRTQYSYELHRDSFELNASTEVDLDKWSFAASIFTSYTESYRDGDFRHHLYQDVSKGKSEVYDSWDAGIKAKIIYKLTGKTFLLYKGAFFSLTPTLNEIFSNPRANNLITPDLKNEKINSNELTYIHRGNIVKMRASGYYTTINNSTEISRYYAEMSGTNQNFVSEITNNVDKKYVGVEAAVEVKILPTLTANVVGSYGEYTIDNNPNIYLAIDANQAIENMGKAYLKDHRVSGTPQQAYSIGLKYNSPKYWWVGASANFLLDQYLDYAALNRTANFYIDPATGDFYNGATPEALERLLKQRKFSNEFMLNANIGKSFLLGRYRLGVSVSVNNILDNRDYVTGGYEQGRKSNFVEAMQDYERPVSHFGPKIWYDRGRSFFANVYFRF